MSSRTKVLTRAIVALLALAAAGCQPTLQDGRFTCASDPDCPEGFVCRASDQRCYRGGEDGGEDGGVGVDAETGVDAGPRDGAIPDDAATGCGSSCIQLMVLNADPTLSGTITYDDTEGDSQQILIPPYGTTTATLDVPNVPVGDVLRVFVPPTLTIFHDLPIPSEGRYLLVLGPASLGASVLMLEADRAPLHTGGYAYIQLIDMTSDETVGLVARGAGRTPAAEMLPNPFEHGTISDVLPFLPDGTGALRLELAGSSPTLIGALLGDRIPATEGTYYVVVAGRVGEHLDAPEGLRFIPALPGATALRSSRLVRFLNTLSVGVTVCDGPTRLATLASGELGVARVPPSSEAWTLTVHTGVDCTTGVTHDVIVGPNVGRTLVSIAGDGATAATWQAVSIGEPLPVAGARTIVVHNALATPSDIAGISGIPSLGTASTSDFEAPATITATTPGGTKTFEWAPTSRQSWVVIARDGGGYTAYEVDSPFDAPWTVTTMPGL